MPTACAVKRTRKKATTSEAELNFEMPCDGSSLTNVFVRWRAAAATKGGGKGSHYSNLPISADLWQALDASDKFVYTFEDCKPSTAYEVLMRAEGADGTVWETSTAKALTFKIKGEEEAEPLESPVKKAKSASPAPVPVPAPASAQQQPALPRRADIQIGERVSIVEDKNTSSGERTSGVVKDILTEQATHTHGIKVRLESLEVGRVKGLLSAPAPAAVPAPAPAPAASSGDGAIDWAWLEHLPLRSDKQWSLKHLCEAKGLDGTGSRVKLVARLVENNGPKEEELKQLCQEQGVGQSGGRKKIAERLSKHYASKASTPATPPVPAPAPAPAPVPAPMGASSSSAPDASTDELDGSEGLDKLTAATNEVATQGAEQLWEQSKAKVEAKLQKFKDKQHIDTVSPQYLGTIPQYANMRKLVSAGKVHQQIHHDFMYMSEADYKYHALKDFFEPRKEQPGYQAKLIDTGILGQGKETMFDVDHVVPSRWGGIDHPRNMVVMHRSM